MKRFVRFMLSGITALLTLLVAAALCTGAIAQTTKHKIPTAPDVAMQKKADVKGHKGVMRGTTNTDRWQASIKHSDRRAARIRAANNKGVK